MESHKTPQRIEGQSLGKLIFECTMAVLYLLFGTLFLFTHLFVNIVPHGWARTGLGVLLGIYGIFRVIRAVSKISLKRNE